MRICAVSPFPPSMSGVSDYGSCLARELASDDGVERVIVLADRVADAPDLAVSGRLEVRRVWQRDRADLGGTLLRAIVATRPDVVWFNLGLTMFGTRTVGAAAGIGTALIARLLGHRTVVTLHELPSLSDLAALGFGRTRGRLAGSAALRVLLGVDDVVVTLERYRRHLAERIGARNVRHIPHGLWERPVELAEPAERSVLVFGAFGPHKDPGIVADAVARLGRGRSRVRPRLLVAGIDHPRFPGFMADTARRHGLNGSWLGYVPRDGLAALFGRSTVVVIPAVASTGSSGVIHRAVGYGRAVLASDLPDFRALASEADLQLAWTAPGDPALLAEKLEELLEDAPRRRAMVAHNMRWAARHGPERTARSYLELFAGRRDRLADRLPHGPAIARVRGRVA